MTRNRRKIFYERGRKSLEHLALAECEMPRAGGRAAGIGVAARARGCILCERQQRLLGGLSLLIVYFLLGHPTAKLMIFCFSPGGLQRFRAVSNGFVPSPQPGGQVGMRR